ncbi:hypothetical protein BKI52_40765 [marine bacterium AO1-C]|nr:hypothetical protein BKI52_40765 [marine bacterium AO1-C]
MIGEKILNYRIDSLIGEGGVGTVYQATHTQLGRTVAIKALNPTLVNNEQVKQRFRQEATTLSNLQHINIITLYDYLENEKGLFLIMEFAKGEALDDFIKKRPIPEEQVRYYFSRILDGMEYAHKKGVIHRDIKPSNVIITEEADAKILDFGIAKILKEGKNTLTQPGAQLGTVLYMSPEQVQGQTVDHRTDIYSLGVTLFEMLTGKPPYDETQTTEFEVFNKIINEPLPALNTFKEQLSDRMQWLIDKATAKNPAERFQSCAEFKEALLKQEQAPAKTVNEAIGGKKELRPTQVKATNTGQEATTAKPTSTPPKKPTNEGSQGNKGKGNTGSRPKKGMSRTPLYILITILVVLTGFLIYNELSGDKKGSRTLSENTTKDTVKKAEDNTVTNDDNNNKTNEKSEEDKKREARQARLDSLIARKKRLNDTLKLVKRQRLDSLRNALLVDGRLIEPEDELAEGITVEVELRNTREDVKFKSIVISLKLYNDAGVEVEDHEHKYGDLNKEVNQSVTFRITREIEASKYQCTLKSVDIRDLNPPKKVDSLNKVITKLEEEIKSIEDN